jgi:hypothetical protein
MNRNLERGRESRFLGSPALTGVFAGATAILLLMQLFGLSLFRGRFDPNRFGDIGTWFTGLATLSAVLVALNETYSRVRRERDELERERVDFGAWLETDDREWAINLGNRTGSVVKFWVVEFDSGAHLCWRSAGPCPPGTTRLLLGSLAAMPAARSYNFPTHIVKFLDGRGVQWTRSEDDLLLSEPSSAPSIRDHVCPHGGPK